MKKFVQALAIVGGIIAVMIIGAYVYTSRQDAATEQQRVADEKLQPLVLADCQSMAQGLEFRPLGLDKEKSGTPGRCVSAFIDGEVTRIRIRVGGEVKEFTRNTSEYRQRYADK